VTTLGRGGGSLAAGTLAYRSEDPS